MYNLGCDVAILVRCDELDFFVPAVLVRVMFYNNFGELQYEMQRI